MYCMKCGKETTGSDVFCEHCLSVMEQYPVKSGTAIHLPRRPAPVVNKRGLHRKRPATPEEQIEQLKKLTKSLIIALAAAVALLGLVSGLLTYHLLDDRPATPTGRNYTIDINWQN